MGIAANCIPQKTEQENPFFKKYAKKNDGKK